MTPTGDRIPRRRSAALAAAALGAAAVASVTALGPTGTMAAFAGDLFAGTGEGLSAAAFRIQSSTTFDGTYADHPAEGPLSIGVTTPISLAPGQTTYVPVYLRTSPGTTQSATVSVAAAQQLAGQTSDAPLWKTYVTYGARVALVEGLLGPPACDETQFATLNVTAVRLFGTGGATSDGLVSMGTAPTGGTFVLGPRASNTFMVCFRFSLNSSVTTGSPSSNGASIHPYWVFSGVPL